MRGNIYKGMLWGGIVLASIGFWGRPVYAKADMDGSAPAISDTGALQGLIDKTGANETCIVPEGSYTISGLSITRPIALKGGGKAKLRYFGGEADDDVFEKPRENAYIFAVWASGVSIDGFVFENGSETGSTGVSHFNGDNLQVTNNEFRIGRNCAGIISKAEAGACLIEGNVFTASAGLRSYPMIQLSGKTEGAKIKNNVLEGDFPDMLSSGFLSNFLTIESGGAVVADNEFSYTGTVNNEDLGGFEDEGQPVAREAFAELTKSRINGANPWIRSAGAKANPSTGGAGGALAMGVAGAVHAALLMAYMLVRRLSNSSMARKS